MKKFYLPYLLLLCVSVQAQIIQIPDPAFKNTLVNTLCVETTGNMMPDDDVDTNNDNEIQVEEALAVTRLIITGQPITSVEGITEFANLEYFILQETEVSVLDVSGMANLEILDCSNNLLTELHLNGLTGLQQLGCSFNQLTTVDASETSAYAFEFSNNPELSYINIRNGVQNLCIILLMEGIDYTCSMFLDLPSLQTVCIDDDEVMETAPPQENVQFVTVCPTAGVDDHTLKDFTLYPNPAKADLNVTSEGTLFTAVNVYNLLGQLVISLSTQPIDTIAIDVASLHAGTYIIEVLSENGKSTQKFIKI